MLKTKMRKRKARYVVAIETVENEIKYLTVLGVFTSSIGRARKFKSYEEADKKADDYYGFIITL